MTTDKYAVAEEALRIKREIIKGYIWWQYAGTLNEIDLNAFYESVDVYVEEDHVNEMYPHIGDEI